MRLNNELEIVDLALYLPKHKTLVIADVHIGFEEALNKQGILVPRFQFREVIERLTAIIATIAKNHKIIKFEKIIVNGDVKHEFGTISEQEWRDTLKLLDFLSSHCNKLILIKGNHDTILGPIANKRNIEIADNITINGIFICHGNKLPQTPLPRPQTYVIAHEHPAVSIHKFPRSELFKCWLKGKWKGRDLIVMPSFNLVTEGTDILKESLLSPFLASVNLNNFECIVVEDKLYNFGKLRNLR